MAHFRSKRLTTRRGILALVLLLFLLAGCWPFPAAKQSNKTPTPVPAPQQSGGTPVASNQSASINTIVQQVIQNVHQNGWNPQTGGLYTNWQMNNPKNTNNLKVTSSDDGNATKHDPQVDLFYLMSLSDYHALHPQDHQFDAEIQRTKQVVLSEIKAYSPFKGWMYFFLLRSGKYLNDQSLQDAASTFAQSIYTKWYDPQVGVVYNRNAQDPNYQPNLALQAGAAMIQDGTLTHQPAMVDAGKQTIDHVLSVDIDPRYHMLYNILTVGSSGKDQVMNTSRYKGYQAKPSTQGEAATALIYAYNVIHDQRYLDVANQLLQTLLASPLVDRQRGGLFFALDMDTGKLENSTKETRSQNLVLIALHNYDLTMQEIGKQPAYAQQEQALISVLTNHFYQSTYHGFFYRVASDFSIYSGINNQGEYFTSEAMGSTTDALQQTEFTAN